MIQDWLPIAKLECEEVHKLIWEWNRLVVISVVRPNPLLFHVQRYVRAHWPQLIRPQVNSHRDAYFLCAIIEMMLT